MSKYISQELKEDIINYYRLKPMTIAQVVQHFKISNVSVINILNEYNIPRYNKSQLFSPNLDEKYFENIDTENKAYFLGLILTDGCIYSYPNHTKQQLVSVTLHKDDKYLIEDFVKDIKSNKTPTSDGRGCYGINILSDIMVNDLRKYGLHERKSLTSIFPQNLPLDMYRHFIRGLIDGDGSIAFYNRKNRKVHRKAIRFCQGNKQFLEDMISFLHNQLDVSIVTITKEKEHLYSCYWNRNSDLKKLIHYLYDDSNIFMIRKKERCDLIMQECLYYETI
jgi:hypothetical protein